HNVLHFSVLPTFLKKEKRKQEERKGREDQKTDRRKDVFLRHYFNCKRSVRARNILHPLYTLVRLFVINSPSHKYSPGVISSTFYFIFNFNQFNHCAKQPKPIPSKRSDDTKDTSTN
uniref:Uncharacterized protein n=1 Tax=Glossina palpalis gambiensis TaxID=67801 RepID=A0A1B0AP58_9MUSC